MTEREFHKRVMPLAEAMYRVAFYILESSQEAEDAVQEALLKLWSGRKKLEAVEKIEPYSMTVLRNVCMDRLRVAARLASVPVPEEGDERPGPDAVLSEKQRLQRVMAAVRALPRSQREVLILRTIEGLSYKEISSLTGMNDLTLRVLLSRARSALRKETE